MHAGSCMPRVTLHAVRPRVLLYSLLHAVAQVAAFTIARHGCLLTGVVDYVVRVHGPTIFVADAVQVGEYFTAAAL